MESLLLGGAPSVGKSKAIYSLTRNLIHANNFKIVAGHFPKSFSDFKVVLEGQSSKGNKVRLIINSASDSVSIIDEFKSFFDENGSYDILISSVRNGGNWPRDKFFSIMNLLKISSSIIELPLEKNFKSESSNFPSVGSFSFNLDRIINHTISLPPYNL